MACKEPVMIAHNYWLATLTQRYKINVNNKHKVAE